MDITADVKLLGVMGHPIGHSKSPVMHNAALRSQRLPYVYLAFDVKPEQLGEAVQGLRAIGARGWNVTIPHKVAIMPFLDEISEEADTLGAVNTVVCEDGRLLGRNTDAEGYLQALVEETGIHLEGQRVLIVGAGGAARAVTYALSRAGVSYIVIANRTLERAEQVASLASKWTESKAVGIDGIGKYIGDCTLVVNTTSVGMFPRTNASPFDPRLLPDGIVVSDLIYNPEKTLLLHEAEARNCTIQNGLGMFVYQGALAYEMWTGQVAPIDVMRKAVARE